MSNNQNRIPENDPLKAKFEGIDRRVRASAELKQAAKTGIPLRAGKKEGAAVHVRRFGKAVVGYALAVAVVIGTVLFVPRLIEGSSLAGDDPFAASPASSESVTTPLLSTDKADVTTTGQCECPNELPYIFGEADRSLADLLNGLEELHNEIDPVSIRAEGLTMWHDDSCLDGGGLGTWFDGSPIGTTVACGEKICGGGELTDSSARVFFSFKQRQTMRVEAYVISIGESDHDSTGKKPISWRLRATNDPSLPVEEWTVLDYVYDGAVLEYEADDLPETPSWASSGYAIDAEVQGSYQYYCWEILYTNNNAIDITEFALYGTVE
ncbi:MAG: hypothetical protein IJX47_00210 [Clostridia bacterium]|nr:hypothetical protein [Clostridia bacterium]